MTKKYPAQLAVNSSRIAAMAIKHIAMIHRGTFFTILLRPGHNIL